MIQPVGSVVEETLKDSATLSQIWGVYSISGNISEVGIGYDGKDSTRFETWNRGGWSRILRMSGVEVNVPPSPPVAPLSIPYPTQVNRLNASHGPLQPLFECIISRVLSHSVSLRRQSDSPGARVLRCMAISVLLRKTKPVDETTR